MQKNYDSMGIGYEIETGGHVFQVHLTNSFGLMKINFLPSRIQNGMMPESV